MNHHQANELCPNCGKAPRHLERNPGLYDERIVCDPCGYSLPPEVWNRRAAPTEPAVDRDAVLEEAARLADAEKAEFTEQAARNNSRDSDFAFGSFNSGERIAAAIRALKLAAPAAPAVQAEDDLDALMYPPKAMLNREDWDAQTRKPKVVQAVPAAPLVASDDPIGDFQAVAQQAKLEEMVSGWSKGALAVPATSIDTPEFQKLMAQYGFAGRVADHCHTPISVANMKAAYDELVAHINAKIAPLSPPVDEAKALVGGEVAGDEVLCASIVSRIEAERVDETGTDGDIAYNHAIDHCIEAVYSAFTSLSRASTGSATSTDTKGGE